MNPLDPPAGAVPSAAAPGWTAQPAREGALPQLDPSAARATPSPAPPPGVVARVAIAGQPNVGKSTLFARLTGASLETGNWPGKTVERREGRVTSAGHTLAVIDLPGTYSLSANSEEERVARDYVLQERPDVLALVLDSTALERGLYLLAEVLLLPVPVVVVLNRTDLAERAGAPVDAAALSSALGLPVVPVVARTGAGLDTLAATLRRVATQRASLAPVVLEVEPETAALLTRATTLIAPYVPAPYTVNWVVHKLIEGEAEAAALVRAWLPAGEHAALDALLADAAPAAMALAGARYAWAGRAARSATRAHGSGDRSRDDSATWTDRIDRFALHPLAGLVLLVALSFGVYELTLVLAGPLQDSLSTAMEAAGKWCGARVAGLGPLAAAFVVDGLFGSVGLLLTFLPVLAVFFAAFALLEDTGYMARAAFVLDRALSAIGLRGKSFLPMFVGAGCNVPAVFGARVIESRSARLLTIILLPLVPCSARLIVLALLVPAFFATHAAGVSIGLIALNIAVIALLGLLLSRTMFRGERQSFIMELPRYSVPSLSAVAVSVWTKLKAFLRDAGTMIVVIAISVWALSVFPGALHGGDATIQDSYLGQLGRFLEPLGAPMDMDWRLIVAILTGFIAKEVVIATLGVLYAASGDDAIVATMQASISPATALAFLVITMLFIPCVGTVAAMRREAGTRWTLFGAGLLLAVSYVFGVGVYRLAALAGLDHIGGAG
ncbi:MAG: ferrous iron transport protein B [Planctomycetota bacterium]